MNIEEAIKIVKKIRQDYNLYYPMDRKEVEAVETLLTAYEKEKEEHKKECHNCDEYTARLGELETENRMLKSELEKQSKEIEELKEDNEHQWEERCKLTFELENSISNDKIKAKIEELDYNDIGNFERRCKQEVLQSLLEKE